MSSGVIEFLVEELGELYTKGPQEEIGLEHLGSAAIHFFHNHMVSSGGLKSWILDSSTDRHLEILIGLTDHALVNGVEDIKSVNELFHRIDNIEVVFDPEVKKITQEYIALDQNKLITAYTESVLLHIDSEEFDVFTIE